MWTNFFNLDCTQTKVILEHLFTRTSEPNSSGYNHFAHEFIRMYGCLTLGVGWFVWNTKSIKDGRLFRAVSETFAICYLLQAAVMARAQWTNPGGHSIAHTVIAVAFLIVGLLYAYIRLGGKLKDFELPGQGLE